jgi:universal stress protein E
MNMSPNDAIVVVVDPRARHHAGLVKGALLARKFQARLDLFACSNRADTSVLLESLARPLRDLTLQVTTQITRTDFWNAALADYLEHTCAKLVIKDVHQQTATRRAVLSDSDWELIRSCPVSLLLSKRSLWPERPQICAVLDPGHGRRTVASLDHVVLDQGATLARQVGGELLVLHAYISPALVVTVRRADDLRAQEHATTGPARDALSSLVSEVDASIIVTGSRAEALLEQIPCDVLVVNAAEAARSLH